MTLLPIRPKDAPGVNAADDNDSITLDGAAGVRKLAWSSVRSQIVGGLTGGLVYRGVIAGDSLPDTSTAAGDYYIVSVSGSSQGKNWRNGDTAIYRGASGQWDQLANLRELNIRDYGALGDGVSNDSDAIQSVLNIASGKTVLVPDGIFICEALEVPSDVKFSGPGTLKYPPNTSSFSILHINGRSNVTLEGLTLDGNIGNQAVWSEHRHCLTIHDSSYVRATKCRFQFVTGDGIYASHPDEAEAPFTGTSYMTVDKCDFIGTSENRNGISLICCANVKILANTFVKMGRSTMPGAVDIEPNFTTEFVTGVTISGNHFIGHEDADLGLQQCIAVNNNEGHLGSVQGLVIDGNTVEGKFRYKVALFGNTSTPDGAKIANNTFRSGTFAGEGGVDILVRDFLVDISNNTLEDGNELGIQVLSGNAQITNNTIHRAPHYGISLGASAAGRVIANRLLDCGCASTDPARGGMLLGATGMEILDNHIESSDPAFTLQGIYHVGGIRNRIARNKLKGIGSQNFNFSVAGVQIWGPNSPEPAVTAFDTVQEASLPPTTGTWRQGEIIWNPKPTAGSPFFWTCIENGTPGTWVACPTSSRIDQTLNFASIPAGGVAELYVDFAAATPADVVVIGIEGTIMAASQGVVFKAYCNSAGTIAIRAENHNPINAVDLPSGTFRIMLIK